MLQSQKNNGGLTAAQQTRKEIWSHALVAAGIAPETIDWTQPEIAAPLYAQAPMDSLVEKLKARSMAAM